MSTNSPIISEKQNQDAQVLSSRLSDILARKRAYIDFTGAFYTIGALGDVGLRANSARSIFKFPKLYLDFEIVDIYCNSHVLYVATAYGTDYVKIPLIHKKYDILPEAYIVVELKIGMKSAEIKGAIYPSDFENAEIDGKYYKFNINNGLQSFDELTQKLKKYTGIRPSVGRHLDCMNLFMPYIDGRLTEPDKIRLIAHILTCETCKKRLTDAIEFDEKAKTINAHKDILSNEDVASKEVFLKRLKDKSNEAANRLDGAIDVIYKNGKLEELDIKSDAFKQPSEITKKTRKIILLAAALILILITLIIFAFSIPKMFDSGDEIQTTVSSDVLNGRDDGLDDFDITVPQIKKNKGYATVSKVSWEVPSEITADEQKNFLQTAGKSIRLNLQNDLLLSSENAVGDKVKFDIRFSRDGSLDEIAVSETSGSGAVDKIIKQSIENTLHYMHPPKGSFMGKKNGITLVIEF